MHSPSTDDSAELRKRVGQLNRQHLQLVVVDVVVRIPCSSPLIQVVVVEVFTKPLKSSFDGGMIINKSGLDVLVKLNVVHAVAQNASFRGGSAVLRSRALQEGVRTAYPASQVALRSSKA